ncbi:MAG: hypothetical protein ACRDO0_03145, partial [Nocardioidaceae bacterium]
LRASAPQVDAARVGTADLAAALPAPAVVIEALGRLGRGDRGQSQTAHEGGRNAESPCCPAHSSSGAAGHGRITS